MSRDSKELLKKLDVLAKKMDTIIKLTAHNSLKEAKTKTEKIGILLGLGLRKKEIALIVGQLKEVSKQLGND